MSKIIIHRPYHWYDRKFGYQVLINQQPVANLCNNEKQEVVLAAPGIIEAKIMWCGSTVVSIDPAKEENIQLRIRPNTTLHQLLLVTVAVSISCIALANLFPQYEWVKYATTAVLSGMLLLLTRLVTVGRRRWILLEKTNH